MRDRTIQPTVTTPEFLADTYLMPWARSGSSGVVRWMPGRDVCDGDFMWDVCPRFCLFQARPDITWYVTATESRWSGFNEWLAVAGRNAIDRAQSRLYDVLFGTGELLKPGRFDCVTSRTPELQAVCEYGTPAVDGVLRQRRTNREWRARMSQHVWAPWPLQNVCIELDGMST